MNVPTVRQHVAERILGSIDDGGYCRCPGAAHHTHRNGPRDCRVHLDGAPTIFCVHSSCAAVIEDVNYRLRSEIGLEERGSQPIRRVSDKPGLALRSTLARPPKVPAFEPSKLHLLAKQCHREITLNWLAERSPVTIPSLEEQRSDGQACSRLFADTLYRPGERILIFTQFYSQGDFLAISHGDTFRLADRPGVKSAPSELPSAAREGMWFLTAPVTGGWKPMPGAESRAGRRHEACVTRFPYLLLESDEADETSWLKALVQLPLPIAALYTSGGRSIHALVKVDCDDKPDFDSARNVMRAVLCPLGADGAAMTAVRLSRLPGGLRQGTTGSGGYRPYDAPRLQRLVYLNPLPLPATALIDLLK